MQISLNLAKYQYNSLYPQIKIDELYNFMKGNEAAFNITQQAWLIRKLLKTKLGRKPPQFDRLFS